MENKDNLPRSVTDLFSTAAVRAAQGWNKFPLGLRAKQPTSTSSASAVTRKGESMQDQTAGSVLQHGQQLGLNSGVAGMPISGSVQAQQSVGMANQLLAGQNLPTAGVGTRSEEELLQEKIFAARMLGASVTVANNIATASNFTLTTSTNIADAGQSSYNTEVALKLAQQQQQQTTLLPAQQEQAKMIAAALFNTIKPVLPTLSTTALTPQLQLLQQSQQQLQMQQSQIQLQQQTQQQQQQPKKQPLEILQELIKPLERKQQPQAKLQQPQQQQPSLAVGSRNVTGQVQSQKWSNTRTRQTSNLKVNSGKFSSIDTGMQVKTKLTEKRPTLGTPVMISQGDGTSTAVTAAALQSASRTSVQSGRIREMPQHKMKATKPFSTKVDSTQSFEVLQSLKDDGYIDSPKSLKCKSGVASKSSDSEADYISTIWPTTLTEDWKSDGSGDNRLKSGVKNLRDGDKKRQGKKLPKQAQAFHAKKGSPKRKPFDSKPLSPWHASVDAFLKSTKRSAKEDALPESSRKMPTTSPTVFSTTATSSTKIPLLTEADTNETISSINRRVEMLKKQKEKILQDEMEEFQREITVLEEESKEKKRSMSLDRDGGRSRSRERECGSSKDSTCDRSRERNKSRERNRVTYRRLIDDRDRRRVSRSPPRKRSPRARSHGEKRGDYKSPSPKRSRGVSQEKSSSKSEARTIKDRQGRYPSKVQDTSSGSLDRRTSVSPDRKRMKSEGEQGEMFIDGRWQKPSSGQLHEKISTDKDNNEKKSETSKSKEVVEGKEGEVFIDGRWQKMTEKTLSDHHLSGSATDKQNTNGKTHEVTTNQMPGIQSQDKKKDNIAFSKEKKLPSKSTSVLNKAEICMTTSNLTKSKEKEDKAETCTETGKGKKDGILAKEKMHLDSGSKDKTSSASETGMSTVASGGVMIASERAKGIATLDKISHTQERLKQVTPQHGRDTASTTTSLSASKVVDSKTTALVSTIEGSGPSTYPTASTSSGQSTSSVSQQLIKKEETSEATVQGRDSSLAEQIKDSSIPHQMGLLRALSIQQYVADKVMVDWFCYVCGCLCHSMKVYMSHINGSKHQTFFKRLLEASSGPIKGHLISKLKLLPEKEVLEAAAGKDCSMTAKTALLAGLARRSTCNRCFRTFLGSLQEHLRSAEHKKFEAIRPRCTDCNLVFRTIEEYRKHLASAHKANIAATEETGKLGTNMSVTDTATSKSSTTQKSNIIEMRHTWVVGDCTVFEASQSVFCTSSECVKWFGVEGAKVTDLVPMIQHRLQEHPAPDIVVIHIGTNDLFTLPVKEIRSGMEEGLHGVRSLLPNAKIVWSYILLRIFYYAELRQGVGKKNILSLNKFAFKICRRLANACAVIHNHNINPSDITLYQQDGWHLSSRGNERFCKNIHDALAFFTQNPEAPFFPPGFLDGNSS